MDQLDFESLKIFVATVHCGSFTDAASQLGVPKSKVSRTIAHLEEHCKGPLFYRTTREITLTDLGRRLFEYTAPGIQKIYEGLKLASSGNRTMSGSITITTVEDIGTKLLTPSIAKLSEIYPNVQFRLVFTLEVLDLVKHGIDIAIRTGTTKQLSYRARKLGDVHFKLVASPQYLAALGSYDHPDTLRNMSLINWYQGVSANPRLRFVRGNSTVEIDPQTRIFASSSESMLTLAESGIGVANLPSFVCDASMRSGKLVEVCSGWSQHPRVVSMVTPGRKKPSALMQYVTDAIAQDMGRMLASSQKLL